MPAQSDYVSGTITLTNGEIDFTGAGTGWLLAKFKEGDTIIDITGATEFMGVVATIDANGAGTLTKPWEGPDLVDVAYRMRYQPDGARVSAQARNLIELLGNGNLQAVAGLSGSANRVLMFTGPGTMTTVPKAELVSGVAYDVQVDLLADRAAYNGQAEGFSVLVSNVGDGRAAVYAKASATSGDWSDPAYVTGPAITLDITEVDEVPYGTAPDVTLTPVAGGYNLAFEIPRGMLIEPGTTTTLAPGLPAAVTFVPVTGGYRLDLAIPAGEGFSAEGDYSAGTAYAKGDVVQRLGSSWIAKEATTGNAPPVLPTTSNTWWQLVAAKGTDGTGTGDVVGPASATDGRLAAADGTSGKLIKYLTAAQATATLNAVVGDSGSGGTKGLVPAPASGDAAASKFLKADGTWATAGLPATSQAEQEAATSVTVAVTPGRQHQHPSAAKVWGRALYSGGVPSLVGGYNIASITDIGVGQLLFSFSTSFSSPSYAVTMGSQDSANNNSSNSHGSPTTGNVQANHFESGSTLTDPQNMSISCFGDQ